MFARLLEEAKKRESETSSNPRTIWIVRIENELVPKLAQQQDGRV